MQQESSPVAIMAMESTVVKKLTGYYNYCGFRGNFEALTSFRHKVRELWLNSLKSRSQKKEVEPRISWGYNSSVNHNPSSQRGSDGNIRTEQSRGNSFSGDRPAQNNLVCHGSHWRPGTLYKVSGYHVVSVVPRQYKEKIRSNSSHDASIGELKIKNSIFVNNIIFYHK